MKKLEEVDVRIVKMRESSGNEQIFVRLVRNDGSKSAFCTSSILEYSCWQTKHLDKQQCLERAWFDASMLARFVGLENMDSVQILGLNEDEEDILKKSITISLRKHNLN